MNNSTLLISLIIFLFCCSPRQENSPTNDRDSIASEGNHAEHLSEKPINPDKKPLSPRLSTMANIGDVHIHIDYGSPGKRGRMIFGGLVGYGQVWATGAHHATSMDFGGDVIINDVKVPAGKYGFFTIPGENEWVLIINKIWDMHLADDYDPAQDVVRLNVPVETLTETIESLTYEISDLGQGKGKISVKWDQTMVSFEVKVN